MISKSRFSNLLLTSDPYIHDTEHDMRLVASNPSRLEKPDKLDGSPRHGRACLTCRRRGRKCDKTLPSCRSCANRGLLCEGYIVQWSMSATPDYPKLEKAHTLSHLRYSTAVGAQGDAYIFLGGEELQEASGDGRTTMPLDKPEALAAVSLLTNSTSEYAINPSVIADGLGDLVHYYARELSSVFYLATDASTNPYFQHILPLSTSVAPLRFAIASSAACHLAVRLNDRNLESRGLHLRIEATNLLRKRLGNLDPAQAAGSLASILMLAQLDMCSGHCTEFNIHLCAARELIRSQSSSITPKRFVEQRLIWLDVMTATTSPRQPVFTQEEVFSYLQLSHSSHGPEWSYDVFPCPVPLFEIITSITFLYKLDNNSNSPQQKVLQDVARHKEQLLQLRWPTQVGKEKMHLFEAYRLGTILYLNGLFHLSIDFLESQRLVSSLMLHAKALPEKTGWSYLLAWPLYQAGLELKHDEETKSWLRNHLQSTVRSVGCLHGQNALNALESAWSGVHYGSRTSVPNGKLAGHLVLI